MNKKLFYGIGIVVFFMLLGVVGYMLYNRSSVGQIGDNAITTPFTNEPVDSQGMIVYRNNTYGFYVSLPESWRGYTVSEEAKGSYLEIRLIHPQSNSQNPRMDVPVLVVPIASWNKWYPPNAPEDGQHPFAAPVPATERARNTKYVFATAPRYNFSYLLGWEEVDEIVKKITALNIFPVLVPVQVSQPAQTSIPTETPSPFEEGEVKG